MPDSPLYDSSWEYVTIDGSNTAPVVHMGLQSVGEHHEQVTQSELGAQRPNARAAILLLRLTHGTTTERAKVVLF
jgi:hypothetical protein